MSDSIKHECGIALIRLLQPLEYYHKKYGTVFHGLNKLYLLMEKQHNRGQDGAGIATIKMDMPPGKEYIYRFRTTAQKSVEDIFKKVHKSVENNASYGKYLNDVEWLKKNVHFIGELMLGHLRYGTHGKNLLKYNHPIHRRNNWMSRNLILAGNFNLTNVDELFQNLIDLGQHPRGNSDTDTILEKIGHFLDVENQDLFDKFNKKRFPNKKISEQIEKELDIQKILFNATKRFDGGYAIAGLIGHGDAFVVRDPSGIRPAFYYHDKEFAVVASERPAIQTTFDVSYDEIKEIKPGSALIIKKEGRISEQQILKPREKQSCSFERIYFSRGSDKEIYRERQMLGYLLAPQVLKEIDYDLENTVFSFIPNTAEVAFEGLMNGIEEYLAREKNLQIKKIGKSLDEKKLAAILNIHPRVEKIAIKDAKMRTFITEDTSRNELVGHVYDITYGSIRERKDTIVIIDDSIVRGTTLRESIITMLDRLRPKKIIIVSSAPQIRYPDCYGIDMSKMGDFAAFQAAVSLLKEKKKEKILVDIYKKCKSQENLPKEKVINEVKKVYDLFHYEQISDRVADIVTAQNVKAKVKIIYQTIENLHHAIPHHQGDWYFSGNYPTPGGNKVVNKAFANYMEKRNERAY